MPRARVGGNVDRDRCGRGWEWSMTAVIGVDLGGTKILARHIDTATGRASGRSKASTPQGGPDSVLAAVIDAVRALDGFEEVDVVGVGVPGLVVEGSVVVRCPNIAGWDEPVDVGAILSSSLGKKVAVGNDVNCGALAEHRLGAGQDVDDLLAVFIGTGVGGGLVLDGRVVDGDRGMAGEIGHLTVVPEGRLCGCGRRGHLEAYAGRAGMERRARELVAGGEPSMLVELAGAGAIKSRHIARALEDGDDVALRLMAEAVESLALVIGNMATMLDLSRVVLGGGVIDKLGQLIVDQIASSPVFGGMAPTPCELRLAARLDDAGVAGAALLASDRFG